MGRGKEKSEAEEMLLVGIKRRSLVVSTKSGSSGMSSALLDDCREGWQSALRRDRRILGSMPAKLTLSSSSIVGIMGAEKESSLPSSDRICKRLRWGGGDKHCVQVSERGVTKILFIVEVWFIVQVWFEREAIGWLCAKCDLFCESMHFCRIFSFRTEEERRRTLSADFYYSCPCAPAGASLLGWFLQRRGKPLYKCKTYSLVIF